jgi:hypothetical protein
VGFHNKLNASNQNVSTTTTSKSNIKAAINPIHLVLHCYQPCEVTLRLPPCLTLSLRACAVVVVHPGCSHTPMVQSPCLAQSLRACAVVVHPGSSHTPMVQSPCLAQSLRACAVVVHPGSSHTPMVQSPCLKQRPWGNRAQCTSLCSHA